MTSPSYVRLAKPEDYQEIWRLFLQGHQENGLFSLAPEKVDYFVKRCLFPHMIPDGDTGPRGVIGVIGPSASLEGIAFVVIGEYWYSREKHLEEFIVLVDPQHRKSDHAKTLVGWMKEQSEKTGLPLITGIMSNDRTEAKCRLYRRMLPKVGEFFCVMPKGATLQTVTVSS